MIPQKPSLSGEGRPFSHPKIEARHKKRIAIFMLFCSLHSELIFDSLKNTDRGKTVRWNFKVAQK